MTGNLEHYKVFYYVAECKSITVASEKLYISQPAVSQSIKLLEQNVGCSLFLRVSKGVKLTPEGELLYKYVKSGYETILSGEQKLEQMLNLEKGEIRIGASDMTLRFFLLTHLEKFHSIYPSIKIIVTNGPTPETIQYLMEGKIDFAVVSAPFEQDEDMAVSEVKSITDIFVAGNGFQHLKDKILSIDELNNLPIICLDRKTSTRRFVDNFLTKNGVDIAPEFELATSELIVKFAEMNLGLGSVVKDFAIDSIESGRLFEVKFSIKSKARSLCVVSSKKSPISHAGRKLLDMII
ncbi:MAG: LysR family transcriptional regulator [Clostridiales bacterium GWF2_38_85]|nr:MAG: LysR family transcriptional regulator [Clostridiales bacterium GWF2_38_85]HBL83660.1 LysR family transcriptional regulator [Clostridiales bacterium]